MTTITPFTGWLLQQAVALDDEFPGLTVHLLRASSERRHVIAAYLSRQNCFRHVASPAELSRFLMTAGHDDILAATFGAVPVGLRSALSRAGPTPHGKRCYGYLHALHVSKARPEMSHLLKTIACTGPKNLRIARALPAALRKGQFVAASRRAPTDAHAHDDLAMPIKTVIASLPSRSKEDREALLQALMDGDAPPSATPPVSGTTTKKSSENQSFRPQSRPDCIPRVSPKTFLDHGLSHSDCTGSGEAN